MPQTTGGLPGSEASWVTAYSKVNGLLPINDLPTEGRIFARGAIRVQVAGNAQFRISAPSQPSVWVDGAEVHDASGVIGISRGRRVLTLAFDHPLPEGAEGLRVEILTPDGSTLKCQPEGGF